MSERLETLAAQIVERFGDKVERVPSICDELTFEIDKDDLPINLGKMFSEKRFDDISFVAFKTSLKLAPNGPARMRAFR